MILNPGMKLTLKYFGQIAEIMGAEFESININESSITLDELNNILINKNNSLKDQPYKFAINHSITEHNVTIKENDEIALLPPFSGG